MYVYLVCRTWSRQPKVVAVDWKMEHEGKKIYSKFAGHVFGRVTHDNASSHTRDYRIKYFRNKILVFGFFFRTYFKRVSMVSFTKLYH